MNPSRRRLDDVSEDVIGRLHVSPNAIRTLLATALLLGSTILSIGAGRVFEREQRERPTLASADAVPPEVSTLVERAESLSKNLDVATTRLERRHARLLATPSILPAAGKLSSNFSSARFHPLLHELRAHKGVDIRAPMGTTIRAAAEGRVRFVGWSRGYGLTAEIDHGYGYVTRYAHASRMVVRNGMRVSKGEKIGEVGQTGMAVAPHLHYEVLVNGKATNPRRFIYSSGRAD
jgi:murein DD-endopeptidase MepM/ murein hydrolase activator NlpD